MCCSQGIWERRYTIAESALGICIDTAPVLDASDAGVAGMQMPELHALIAVDQTVVRLMARRLIRLPATRSTAVQNLNRDWPLRDVKIEDMQTAARMRRQRRKVARYRSFGACIGDSA